MYFDHVFCIPSYIISPPIKSHLLKSSPLTFLYFAFLSATELNRGFLQEYMGLVTRVRTASQWLHSPSFSNHWLHVDIQRDGALWANIIYNWMSTDTILYKNWAHHNFCWVHRFDTPSQADSLHKTPSFLLVLMFFVRGDRDTPFTGVHSIVTRFRQFLTIHSYCCTVIFHSRL